MNDRSNRFSFLRRLLDSDDVGPPPRDDLDELLRIWHAEHAAVAAASRSRTLAAIAADRGRGGTLGVLARIGRSRTLRLAAVLALVAGMAYFLATPPRGDALAQVVQVADGGELNAFDASGELLGPCPLQRTDVDAEISGPVTRVAVRQRYANPYATPIEAVYTFPLSHRAAVDGMRILVRGPSGDRIIEGEVRERDLARRIYEAARQSGRLAGLLEQERPNVFTQSVANIEPGATVIVEISYVEWLERTDGVYSFAFPMTVAPRYVPAAAPSAGRGAKPLPAGLVAREGVVLLGPASIAVEGGDAGAGALVHALLGEARAIRAPAPEWYAPTGGPTLRHAFTASYANGSRETGRLFSDGTGEINGRHFLARSDESGGGFAADTPAVADASRITPMPVPPSERAGHDVSIRVAIDPGIRADARALRELRSPLHEIDSSDRDGRTVVELRSRATIPNRDFVLSWRTDGESVGASVLTHVRERDDESGGGFVAVVLDPPSRVAPATVPPREIVFVVDVSGSMRGFPLEQSKALMRRAIEAMRPSDSFNVIAFAAGADMLWPEPRPATEESRAAALAFVDAQRGGGGTELMRAIDMALRPSGRPEPLSPAALADLPADGREVVVAVRQADLDADAGRIALDRDRSIRVRLGVRPPTSGGDDARVLELAGRWTTVEGDRRFDVDVARFLRADARPTRFALFLTDGLVGNDGAIVQAVRDHASTARVFTLGIGNSVNRFLIEEMAREGRGASEVVLLESDAAAAIDRLERRMRTPVLVDVAATFEGIEILETIPDPTRMPDLFDERPILLVGRYTTPGRGRVVLRGRTGEGAWEQSIDVDLPARAGSHASLPNLWARARIDELVAPHRAAIEAGSPDPALRDRVVAIGERFGVVSAFTSFVAVEAREMTVAGTPMRVRIPIELPEGTAWSSFFGRPAETPGRGEVTNGPPVGSGGAESRMYLGVAAEPAAPAPPAASPPAPLAVAPPVRARFDEQPGSAPAKRTPSAPIAAPGGFGGGGGRESNERANADADRPRGVASAGEPVDAIRAARLARVLDRRLLGLLEAPDRERTVQIVILFDASPAGYRAGLAWLESRAIALDARDDEGRIVVVRVRIADLETLAMEPSVRRIEALAR